MTTLPVCSYAGTAFVREDTFQPAAEPRWIRERRLRVRALNSPSRTLIVAREEERTEIVLRLQFHRILERLDLVTRDTPSHLDEVGASATTMP